MPADKITALGSVLRGLGGLGDPIRAVKLGPSVVAVLATLALFAVLVVGAISWALAATPLVALMMGGVVIVFVLVVIWLLLRFAERNPLVAALGGGQIVKALEMQIGAKDPRIIDGTATPVSGTAHPPQEDGHGA